MAQMQQILPLCYQKALLVFVLATYLLQTDTKGIPLFWYTAMQNNPKVYKLGRFNDCDSDILAYLLNIRTNKLPREKTIERWVNQLSRCFHFQLFNKHQKTGFQVHFDFAPNEFFSNSTLTKNLLRF